MEKITINDLYEIDEALVHDGYKLKEHKNGHLTYVLNNETLEVLLTDYLDEPVKTLKPDYDNCILNVVSSIKKYFNKSTGKIKTSPYIDEILKEKNYKHIAILVLDGMGQMMVQNNLSSDSFIKTHNEKTISSVYPSTTACAIPAIQSGKEPLETCWVGWEQYIKELNQNVVFFKDTDYFTGEKVSLKMKELYPYENFFKDFDCKTFMLGPKFYPEESACETFDSLMERYLNEVKDEEKSFAYLYWDDPDLTQHEFGSYSKEAKEVTSNLNACLEELEKNLPDDTLIIVSADHGHIDVNPIYLYNFESVCDTFARSPSNEGRCTFFKIKLFQKTKFVNNFKRYFGSYFKLMTAKEFVKSGYLGKNLKKLNPKLMGLIGDYVCIATNHFYFNFNPKIESKLEDPFVFKSHHAGATANEMLVPLVIIKK